MRGDNDSHYRAYIALNERDIIEIRVANHYATKKSVLDKSNNKAQYLCQVVLITTPKTTRQEGTITDTTRVGNTKVLTQKELNQNSTIDDLNTLFMSIHDYLINPSRSFEEAQQSQQQPQIKTENKTTKDMKESKQIVKLNESQLRQVIKESIKKVLNEDEYEGSRQVWNLIEELEQVMSIEDILSSLIGHIGTFTAMRYLEDIKRVAGLNIDDEEY